MLRHGHAMRIDTSNLLLAAQAQTRPAAAAKTAQAVFEPRRLRQARHKRQPPMARGMQRSARLAKLI
jgi:hypothetical protein